jgi:hypothetical protein
MTEKRRDVLTALALFFLAFGERFFFLWGSLDKESLFSVFYYGDVFYYHGYATGLLHGTLFNNGLPWHAPLFSFFLFLIYTLGGQGVPAFLIKIFLSVLGAASIVLLYLMGRRVVGRGAALLAGILSCFSFSQLVLCSSLNEDCLYQFLLFSLLFLFCYEQDRWTILTVVLLGFLAGFTALSGDHFLSFLPLLGVALYFGFRARALARVGGLVVFFLAAALAIAPWALRNYRLIGVYNETNQQGHVEPLSRFAPVTDTAGADFLSANNVLARGEFSREYISGPNTGYLIPLDAPLERHLFNHGWREGARFFEEHPARAMQLMGRKLGIFLQSLSLGFFRDDLPLGLRGIRRPADIFSPDGRWFLYVQLCLLLFGLGLHARRRGRGLVFHLLFLHALGMTLLFFGFVKRGVVLLPLFYLFIAYGIVFLFPKFRIPETGKAATALKIAGIVAVALLFCRDAIRSANPIELKISGSLTEDGTRLIQENTIRIVPLKETKEKEEPGQKRPNPAPLAARIPARMLPAAARRASGVGGIPRGRADGARDGTGQSRSVLRPGPAPFFRRGGGRRAGDIVFLRGIIYNRLCDNINHPAL